VIERTLGGVWSFLESRDSYGDVQSPSGGLGVGLIIVKLQVMH
jgi:hypothetical protein